MTQICTDTMPVSVSAQMGAQRTCICGYLCHLWLTVVHFHRATLFVAADETSDRQELSCLFEDRPAILQAVLPGG